MNAQMTDQMKDQSCDICIVGAGIVGAALALAVAPSGLRIRLLDAGARPANPTQNKRGGYGARVSAINLASAQLLQNLGVWETIRDARISPYKKMQVWDANSQARIEFNCDDSDFEQLGYIIENDLMVCSLLDQLAQHDNVDIQHDTAISQLQTQDSQKGAQQLVTTAQATFAAGLVVGADGQHSAVRKLAKLPVEISHFDQTAIVARIKTSLPHQQCAYQCFHQSGPIAYLPLKDGSSSIVWSCDQARARELLALTKAELAKAVAAAMDHTLGEVTLQSKAIGFALKQIHAKRYVKERIALAGDAAHRTHPLAGLGANIGLLDAAALTQVIQDKLAAKRDIGLKQNLRPYERWRRSQNSAVLTAMQSFKTTFGSTHPAVISARELTLNSVDKNKALKAAFSQYAMGTGAHLLSDLPPLCRVRPPYS